MSSSRLASLLVQEGLVSARKMAQAFQRQVIYGGTLDTILLEMDVLSEAALVEALGRASGLPTAGDLPSRDQLDAAGVKEWFSHALVERFRAVPVSIDGNVVRVLVTDPPDRKQLDELGYTLSRSIDPIIVPEHRFAHAVEMVYGVPVPARFASLAAKVRYRTESQPRVVQMEAEPARPVARETPPPAAPEAQKPVYTAPPTAQTVRMPTVSAAPEVARTVVTDVPMPQPKREEAAPSPVAPADDRTPRLAPREEAAPQAVQPEVTVTHTAPMAMISTPPALPSSPLPLAEAAQALEDAEDREAIFAALCRGARAQLDFVALFLVHGEVAAGRHALADGWLSRDTLAQVSVALEPPSPFRTAVQSRAPFLGRVGDEAAVAQPLTVLGRKTPLSALLLPIVLRDRVVALLYGDLGGRAVEMELVTELSTLVATAGRAFQRLILKQKSAGRAAVSGVSEAGDPTGVSVGDYKPAPSGPSAKLSGRATGARESDVDKTANVTGAAWRRPDGLQAPAGGQPEGKITRPGFAALAGAVQQQIHDAPTAALPPGPARSDAQALVQSVMHEDQHAAMAADALVELGETGAEAVVAHLPGPLRLARHALRGPTPPLNEHGPLLAVLARLGRAAMRPLLQRLNDASLEVRYYATLACGELRTPEVVLALGQRLLDPDAGVRHAAAHALACFPMSPELRTLTESLRGELPGPETQRQQFAAEAMGVLRDVPSVPRLIELVKHADPQVVAAARKALVDITKQDFGTSRWRWRSWWERHRHEPRVEWMLEGLGHADAEVRLSASDELRHVSSESFGYHFDSPKREREEARRKWVDWVRQHGTRADKHA